MHIKYDNIKNYTQKQYQNFLQTLSPHEKEKINKLLKTNDKQLSILGKILLQQLLKEKYNLNYTKLKFYYNKNQKPMIKNLYFNISHSNSYTVVATSKHKIGIDIEKIRTVNLNIINTFCTIKEKEYIEKSKNKIFSLFQIYCLKEAYIKMTGSNIFSIKEIEFIIEDNHITCCNRNDLNIKLIYDIPNYIIAIIEENN